MFDNKRILRRVIRTVTTPDPVLRVQRFYEIQLPKIEFAGRTTHYMNLGYWEDGTATLDEASEALAVRLADAAGFKPDDHVLDVGNGYGDQDFAWLRDRRVGSIVGLNITPHHIKAATRRAAKEKVTDRVEFRSGSATELPFEDGSFDRVVALESAFHFFPRSAFFAEAMRVLRPGGVLATADIIPVSGETPQMGLDSGPLGFIKLSLDPANWHDSGTYAAELAAAGFADIEVESIRDRVWEPWRRYMVSKIEDRKFRRQIGRSAHAGMATHWGDQELMKKELELLDYVIAVAHKR